MRAGIVRHKGAVPELADIAPPQAADGCIPIDVETAGLGGWDILGAYQFPVDYPAVVRGEGVGRAPDGRRVYFGERSLSPFGAWAERTIVPQSEVWDVPDDVDDFTAITMGIAGTGSLVPLEQAAIRPGETVLILGATGVLGQIALQLARVLGAGHVVGAARNGDALARLKARGVADAVVTMGTADDRAALSEQSHGGYDVVLDLVYGEPMLAALRATRKGARVMTVGIGAGPRVDLVARDLLSRNLTVVGTGQRAPDDREALWRRLLKLTAEHRIEVDRLDFGLDRIGEAWTAQAAAPHAKITGPIRSAG